MPFDLQATLDLVNELLAGEPIGLGAYLMGIATTRCYQANVTPDRALFQALLVCESRDEGDLTIADWLSVHVSPASENPPPPG